MSVMNEMTKQPVSKRCGDPKIIRYKIQLRKIRNKVISGQIQPKIIHTSPAQCTQAYLMQYHLTFDNPTHALLGFPLLNKCSVYFKAN